MTGIAKLVGVRLPSLHEFLHTPGAGSKVFPKLCRLYGIDPLVNSENAGLDEEQRELLRVLEEARAQGRDSSALVAAFRTLVTGSAPPTHRPPKSRGSQSS